MFFVRNLRLINIIPVLFLYISENSCRDENIFEVFEN